MKLSDISFSIALFLFLVSLIWVSGSDARPFRPEKLPDQGQNWSCATCHINPGGGGARNAFGQDYEGIALPAGDVYTAELGQTDSDGDGFTNDDEFNANPPTEPWNPDSRPEVVTAVEARGKALMPWAKLKSQIGYRQNNNPDASVTSSVIHEGVTSRVRITPNQLTTEADRAFVESQRNIDNAIASFAVVFLKNLKLGKAGAHKRSND